jgi:ATP-dependent RNA helicase DOB1
MGFLAEAPGPGENIRGNGRRSIGGGGGGDSLNKSVVKIIRTIRERDMLPCIIFSFSRKECEMYATNVKQMDFNDGLFEGTN